MGADADKTLELFIKTYADVTGITLTNEQATVLKENLDKLGEKTKEAGEAGEHANAHHRESRLLFSEINRIVPGLGHALHAAFAGPLGPIILVGIAIHE